MKSKVFFSCVVLYTLIPSVLYGGDESGIRQTQHQPRSYFTRQTLVDHPDASNNKSSGNVKTFAHSIQPPISLRRVTGQVVLGTIGAAGGAYIGMMFTGALTRSAQPFESTSNLSHIPIVLGSTLGTAAMVCLAGEAEGIGCSSEAALLGGAVGGIIQLVLLNVATSPLIPSVTLPLQAIIATTAFNASRYLKETLRHPSGFRQKYQDYTIAIFSGEMVPVVTPNASSGVQVCLLKIVVY